MLRKIKELFRPQSPVVMAQMELEAARRDLLIALTAVDYARSVGALGFGRHRLLNRRR